MKHSKVYLFKIIHLFACLWVAGCSRDEQEPKAAAGTTPVVALSSGVGECTPGHEAQDCASLNLSECQRASCEETQSPSGSTVFICQVRPAFVTTSCNDGNACTIGDHCSGMDSSCIPGATKSCPNNPCAGTAVCDATLGCVYINPPNFDDGDPCNGVETCKVVSGVAKKVAGTSLPNGTSCPDDGDRCTSDICQNRKCRHPDVAEINDNNRCTSDSCNPETGVIQHVEKNVDDNNPCTIDSCDRITGKISHTEKTSDQLDDGNPCTNDTCTKKDGIQHPAKQSGAACDDQNSCTSMDHCDGISHCIGVTDATAACGISPPTPPNSSFKPDLPPGPTKEVGSIPGRFAVSSSGAAQYAISFEVPPGRAGLTPSLGLNYSSEQGNSIAGVGFSISGVSSITRCPSTVEPDGFVREVRYDNFDNYCLDGARLAQVASGEYRTVPNSFSRITSHTENGVLGPAWFKVETKDGRIFFYGAAPDQPINGASAFSSNHNVREWLLHTIQDRHGNKIEFIYGGTDTPTGGAAGPPGGATGAGPGVGTSGGAGPGEGGWSYARERVLSSVKYPPNNHIEFSYEDRNDSQIFYSGGMELGITKRLSSVEVFSGENSIRNYLLTYEDPTNHASARSRLAKVKECAGGAGAMPACKPSTNFSWNGLGSFSAIFSDPVDLPVSVPNYVDSNLTIWDWNGDGLHETLFIDRFKQNIFPSELPDPSVGGPEAQPATFLSVQFSKNNTNSGGLFLQGLAENTTNRWSYFYLLDSGGATEFPYVLPQTFVFDYDGDGRDDLIPSGQIFSDQKFTFMKYDGSSFKFQGDTSVSIPYMPPDFLVNPTFVTPVPQEARGSVRFGDFNGDGLQDMLQCWPPATGASPPLPFWVLHLHSGTGYKDATSQVIHDLQGTPCNAVSFGFDKNGDGQQELIFEPVISTDIDGNQTFYGYRSFEATLTPKISGGFRSDFQVVGSTFPGEYDYSGYGKNNVYVVLDVNGDGLQDVVFTSKDGKKLFTTINSGNGFLPPFASLNEVFDRDTYPAYLRMAIPIDINNDGKMELLLPGEGLGHWDLLSSIYPNNYSWYRQIRYMPIDRPEDIGDPTNPPGWIRNQIQKTIDLNGDGVPDLIGVKNGILRAYKNNLFEEDTLKTIDEGTRPREEGEAEHVPTVEISYGHLNGESNLPLYPRTSTPRSHRVVQNYKLNNGLAGNQPVSARSNSFTLSYSDGIYDRLSHRFLGFKERTISQDFAPGEKKNIFVKEKYSKIEEKNAAAPGYYPYAGMLTTKEITVSDGQMYHRTEDVFAPTVKGSAGTFFVYTQTALHTVYEGGLDISNVVFYSSETTDVDDFGNTIFHETASPNSYPSPIKHKRQENTTFSNDTNNWLIGRPINSTTCETSASYPVTDGCGAAIFSYTSFGDLQSITVDPFKPESWLRTTFHYDDFGNTIGTTSQDTTNTTRSSWIFYDEQGYLPYARVNSLGHTQLEKYNSYFGELTQLVDANGATQRKALDRFGRLTSKETPDGVVLTADRERTRAADNEIVTVLRVSSSEGQNIESTINSIGNTINSKFVGFDGALFSQSFSYDRFGRKISETKPAREGTALLSSSYEYDLFGRLTKTTSSDNKIYEFDFKNPKQIRIKNPKNNTSIQFLDTAGRIVKSADALQGETFYEHGAFGSTKVTTPDSKITTENFNYRGQLLSHTDPDSGTSSIIYNAFGELTKEINALHTTTYDHDSLGRITKRASGNELSTWGWDTAPHGIGQPNEIISADQHRETFEYDEIGRIKSKHFFPHISATGPPDSYNTTFEYENEPGKGRVKRITYPHGPGEPDLSIRYVYDAHGLMTGIFRDNGIIRGSALWRWTGSDDQGHLAEEEFGNGLQTLRQYNASSELVEHIATNSAASGPLQAFSYTYDNNDNLKSRSDDLLGLKETIVYDELDRIKNVILTTPNLAGGTHLTTLDYDASGNIKSFKSGNSNTKIWEYDPNHPHAVTKAFRNNQTYNFKYDNIGRQTKRGTTSFEYTSFNKPKTFKVNNSTKATFTYDSNHNRVTKSTVTGSTLYIDQLYERYDDGTSGETFLKYTVYNQERAVAVVENKREPSSRTQPWTSSTIFIHPDNLGSPTLITDENGDVALRRSYDVFGKPRSATDWWTAAEGSSEALQISGYTGHEDDLDLGLVNMKGRMYDPNIGRFLTPDPIVQAPLFSQSWNRYSYVFNNPLSFTDPSGFEGTPPQQGDNGKVIEGEVVTNWNYTAPENQSQSSQNQTRSSNQEDTQSGKAGVGAWVSPRPPPVTSPASPSPLKDPTITGFAFGFLQGLIPFAGFVPSKHPDNAEYEIARAEGNIVGGALSIALGAMACGTGAGCSGGGPLLLKSGATVANAYKVLMSARGLAIAAAQAGAATGAIAGAATGFNNGLPQGLQSSSDKKFVEHDRIDIGRSGREEFLDKLDDIEEGKGGRKYDFNNFEKRLPSEAGGDLKKTPAYKYYNVFPKNSVEKGNQSNWRIIYDFSNEVYYYSYQFHEKNGQIFRIINPTVR